jgi:hypothetical protein
MIVPTMVPVIGVGMAARIPSTAATPNALPPESFFISFWMRNTGMATARKHAGIVRIHANAAISGTVQSASTIIRRSAEKG